MVKPEETQLEELSDASFLGELLVLPTIDWKVIPRYKHSSLLGLIVSDKGKKFYNIDRWNSLKPFFLRRWYPGLNKLECVCLESLQSLI